MITPRKLWKMLTGPRPLYKALVVINSTPLRFVTKRVVTLGHVREKSLRRSLVRTLGTDDATDTHVENIRRQGYTMLGSNISRPLVEELHAESVKLVQRADAIAESWGQNTSRFSEKRFWTRLLDEEMAADRLSSDSVFVRFAMQPEVVRMVANYFGEVPVIEYVFLSLSRHVAEPLTASQLWHRDKEDVKVLKLFTYLSDVSDPSCGPFTFYAGEVSDKIQESFIPKHIRDEEMLRRSGHARPTQVLASSLSSFLVDTARCYHMGSRVEEGKSRLMYTASFVSAPSMFPHFSNHIVTRGGLSQTERLLLRM